MYKMSNDYGKRKWTKKKTEKERNSVFGRRKESGDTLI